MSVRVWAFSDSRYVGGAERYLDWHLRAAGPDSMGLIVVDHPAVGSWLLELQRDGYRVETLDPAGRVASCLAFLTLLLRLRPRVLHVNLPGPYDAILATAPFWAKLAGVPRVIVTEHLPTVGRVGRRYWAKRVGLPFVDVAIALCARHGRFLEQEFRYSASQIRVIPNGVPEPDQKEQTREDADATLRYIQVGNLVRRKGGAILLEAFALAIAQQPAIELVFIGDGDASTALRELASKLGVNDAVVFRGHVEDVVSELRRADVGVLASYREGMPLSLLEMAAVGLASITTDVDGCPDVVIEDETGWIVPPGDVNALAAAMIAAAVDAERRERFGRAARARYEREFRVSIMTERSFDCYGDVKWMAES